MREEQFHQGWWAVMHRRFFAACVLLLAGAVSVVDAQSGVSATSGDPATIAKIRAAYTAIEADTVRFRRTQHDIWEFSLEGGVLAGFYEGAELRKLSARFFGESGRSTSQYYYIGGKVVFVYEVTEIYDHNLSGHAQIRIENRFYFDNGKLIRLIRTQSPQSADVLPGYDPKPADLLSTEKLLAACAAATGKNPPACTAPPR